MRNLQVLQEHKTGLREIRIHSFEAASLFKIPMSTQSWGFDVIVASARGKCCDA